MSNDHRNDQSTLNNRQSQSPTTSTSLLYLTHWLRSVLRVNWPCACPFSLSNSSAYETWACRGAWPPSPPSVSATGRMWAKCSETLLRNTLLTIVRALVCYCEVFCRYTCQISCLEQLTCCTTEQWRWTATVQTEIIGIQRLFCFLLTISAFVAF